MSNMVFFSEMTRRFSGLKSLLLALAVTSTALGGWGLYRYDTDEVDEALTALPGLSLSEGVFGALRVGFLVAEAVPRILSKEKETEEQRARRLKQAAEQEKYQKELARRMEEGYREFRTRHWSPEIQERLEGICPGKLPDNTTNCLNNTRDALHTLRTELAETRSLFERIIVGGGMLWLLALALFLWTPKR